MRKLIRSRFTNPWKYTPQDSTSSRRRICVDPWGGGVQGFLWRMHKLDILMHFRCNLWRNTLTYFCTHCLSIPVREFRSVQAWWSSHKLIKACVRGAVRALGSCFKRKRSWRSWHHDLESIRHDLESLCSDNDPRCHIHKIIIISSDWIALLCRLLIIYKIFANPYGKQTVNVSVYYFLQSA